MERLNINYKKTRQNTGFFSKQLKLFKFMDYSLLVGTPYLDHKFVYPDPELPFHL